jgi:hypothetical protein
MQNRLSNPGWIDMKHLRNCTIAIAVLLLAAPLTAQTTTSTPDTAGLSAVVSIVSPVPTAVLVDGFAPASAPAWVNARSAVRSSAPQTATVRVAEAGATPRNKALMIVGGAGLLVGAVVGGQSGTLIMGASGVIGLIGLWNYLK